MNYALYPVFKKYKRNQQINSNDLGKKLQSILASKTSAVLNFCADVVYKNNYSPPYGSGFETCNRHYAVAVGLRFQNNKAEVLMRDSMCSTYSNKYKKSCDSKNQYWIELQKIMTSTESINWLE